MIMALVFSLLLKLKRNFPSGRVGKNTHNQSADFFDPNRVEQRYLKHFRYFAGAAMVQCKRA
jgi:hypothetical protein